MCCSRIYNIRPILSNADKFYKTTITTTTTITAAAATTTTTNNNNNNNYNTILTSSNIFEIPFYHTELHMKF